METTTGIRIDLPLANLLKRRVTNFKECHLTLFDKYIQYKVVGEYESCDDDPEIWKTYIANYRWTRKKELLADVDMHFDNTDQLWTVLIEFNGIEGAACWHFETPQKALAIYSQLSKYMVGE